MRIITGKAKGLRLKTIEHPALKPIDDKVKGAIFNMLAPRIEGSAVCDFFAGCGAIGLEAMSRGAERAVFVEKRREFGPMLRENIAKVGVDDQCEVWLGDVFQAIQWFHQRSKKFDLVFVDPPYFDWVRVDEKGRIRQIEFPRKASEEDRRRLLRGFAPRNDKETHEVSLPQMVLNFLDKYPILNSSGLAVFRTYRRVPLSTENLRYLKPTRAEAYGEAVVTFFTTKE